MAKIFKQMQKSCYASALLICMDQTPSLNRLQLQEGKCVERKSIQKEEAWKTIALEKVRFCLNGE